MKVSPPKFMLRFFKWFCDPALHDFIEGDLLELYGEHLENYSTRKANQKFMADVMMLMRPGIIRSFYPANSILNPHIMLKNYLKVAWRNLFKYRLHSLINISGLTIGMVSFVLIALYLQYELSYDAHHEKSDQVYRIIQQQKGNIFRASDFFAVTPEPLAKAMLDNFPEVQAAVTVNDPRYASETVNLAYGEKIFSPEVLYANREIFDVFTISMLEGEGSSLDDPGAILLSESLAKKYFGQESPMGKDLILNKEKVFTVRGLFEDTPHNQHIDFDFIIPLSHYAYYNNDVGRWGSNNYRTYVVLQEGQDPKSIEGKMSIFDDILEEAYRGAPFRAQYYLQPIRDIHLHSVANFESTPSGDIRYIYLFASIAFILLALASINYMNLATSRSINRSKEVGMRKVLGAHKVQLVSQFLGESFLLAAIAFGLALVIARGTLPLLNNYLGYNIPFDVVGNPWFLIVMLGSGLLIGGFSGLYPAVFLSSVTPIKAIEGKILNKVRSGNGLRNALIVLQFVVAVVLGVSAIIVYNQLQFIQNKKLGYNREQVVYIPYYTEEIGSRYDVIRNELLMHPQISQVALSNSLLLNTDNQGVVDDWEGNPGDEMIHCYRQFVDYHFFDLYEMEILQGRNFSPEFALDSSTSYILNESAVAALGWLPSTAVGMRFNNGRVIGVVRDFHFQPMDLKIEPLSVVLRTDENSYANYGNISIKIGPEQIDETIADINQTIKNIVPGEPFECHFLDQSYEQQYRTEQRLAEGFRVFTFLVLFIACFGLFGLISYTVVQRAKEIGIRKVLGASEISIVQLLSIDFLKLVLLAIVIAIPIAWYLMQSWLQGFAYHTNLHWWIFVSVGVGALFVAFVTVSLQSLRAAKANPSETLYHD